MGRWGPVVTGADWNEVTTAFGEPWDVGTMSRRRQWPRLFAYGDLEVTSREGQTMSERRAIDALLAAATPARTPLPPAEERCRLREGLHLVRAQLAMALGVSASTVGGWEAGLEPGGEVREAYAYFLEGAAAKLNVVAASTGHANAWWSSARSMCAAGTASAPPGLLATTARWTMYGWTRSSTWAASGASTST